MDLAAVPDTVRRMRTGGVKADTLPVAAARISTSAIAYSHRARL
jgi:hypothetical protein